MARNHGAIKDVAAAVQSIVIAVGLTLGGIWAYYKFYDTESREAKIAIARAKLEFERQPNITLKLIVEKIINHRGKFGAYGYIQIVNRGKAGIDVDMRKRAAIYSH